MNQNMPRLDKSAFSISNLNEKDDEKAYWSMQNHIERLNAVELCRRMVYGESRTASRLQRFFEVETLHATSLLETGGTMARINMEAIVDELEENFTRVLKAVVDETAPDNTADARQIMRIFRMRLERGFGRWEHVSDRCIDSGY